MLLPHAARAGEPRPGLLVAAAPQQHLQRVLYCIIPCLSCCARAGDITIGTQNSTIEYGAQLVDYIRIRLTGVADNLNKSPQPVRRTPRRLHGH